MTFTDNPAITLTANGKTTSKKEKTMNECIGIDEVIANIREAMESLDGNEVAEAHNLLCDKKIRYDEDSMWEYTGEED